MRSATHRHPALRIPVVAAFALAASACGGTDDLIDQLNDAIDDFDTSGGDAAGGDASSDADPDSDSGTEADTGDDAGGDADDTGSETGSDTGSDDAGDDTGDDTGDDAISDAGDDTGSDTGDTTDDADAGATPDVTDVADDTDPDGALDTSGDAVSDTSDAAETGSDADPDGGSGAGTPDERAVEAVTRLARIECAGEANCDPVNFAESYASLEDCVLENTPYWSPIAYATDVEACIAARERLADCAEAYGECIPGYTYYGEYGEYYSSPWFDETPEACSEADMDVYTSCYDDYYYYGY